MARTLRMARRPRTARRSRQEGVMLLEALIGILIFSIGILALVAMQTVGMQATVDAKYRSEAAFLANDIVGRMWGDAGNLAAYETPVACPSTPPFTPAPCDWINKVTTMLPQDPDTPSNTAPEIEVNGREVTVTVRWKRPGDATISNHQVVAQIFRADD